MATLDIILLILFVPGIVRGLMKGIIEQVAAIVTIIASGKLAYDFSGTLSVMLQDKIQLSPQLLYVIAFLMITIVCSLVIIIISKIATKIIDSLSLGWINRVLGMVFSIVTTALVAGLLFTLFTDLNTRFLGLGTEFMDQSVIYPWIKDFCDLVFPHFSQYFE